MTSIWRRCRSLFRTPEHRFVNLVWAIESLHRGWQRDAGEPANIERRKRRIEDILSRFLAEGDKKLREWLAGRLKYAYEPRLEGRIVETFQRLPFAIDPRKLRTFAQRCARRRNDISHEGGRRPARMSKISEENSANWRRLFGICYTLFCCMKSDCLNICC